MNWQVFWHDHKLFLRNVGVGAVLYVTLMYYADSLGAQGAQLARSNERLQDSLLESEEKLRSVEGREMGRSAALEKELEPRLFKVLFWDLPASRKIPEGTANAYLDFCTKKTEVQVNLRSVMDARNLKSPSYGFLSEDDERLITEHLYRLDVTEALISKLVEAGASSIDRVKQGELRARPLDFVGGERKFMSRVPVSVECRIAPGALPGVLAHFQEAGRMLEVDRFQISRSASSKGDTVRVEMTLSALVSSDKPLSGEAARGEGADEKAGGRRVRPLRRFGRTGRRR